ncbi:MAG TPA: hypothetical protein VHZ07_27185 [Bryobacteraceae bacterium]|nr:hypothetical protein [Bryobacteraceae bacterium]
MKKMQRRVSSSVSLMAACAAALVVLPALQAQDSIGSSSSVPEIHEQTLPRIWVGISANMSPLKLFTNSSNTNSNGDFLSTTVANGQAGGGLNLSFHLLHNYWLNIGGSYYFGGYDTSDFINDTAGTVYVERTRARIFDFPVLVRYTGPKFRWSRYSFYELGGTLRLTTSIDVHETAADENGYFCCAPTTGTRFKNETEGVTVGTGLVFKDDFGIKSAPEIRYTRYLNSAIAGPTVGTMRNQLEVAITFGR